MVENDWIPNFAIDLMDDQLYQLYVDRSVIRYSHTRDYEPP